MLCLVVAQGAHHLLIEAHHTSMTIQLFYLTVGVRTRAARVRHVIVFVVGVANLARQLLERFEKLVSACLERVVAIVRRHQTVEHFPDFLVLVLTHLDGLGVVHRGQNAPEHEMREAQALTRLLYEELLESFASAMIRLRLQVSRALHLHGAAVASVFQFFGPLRLSLFDHLGRTRKTLLSFRLVSLLKWHLLLALSS